MKKNIIILFFPAESFGQKKYFPYGILRMERMIRDLNIEIILIDEQIQNNYNNIIYKYKDRILLSVVNLLKNPQINRGIVFSKLIKNYCPESYVIWSGWQPSFLQKQTISEKYIDFLITGQEEIPFRQLVKNIIEKKLHKLIEINGIVYKKNGKIITTPHNEFSDINKFPKINYNLIDINNYVFKNSFSKRCIKYFASHGCPFHCSFCGSATIYKGKWYHKNINDIIEDLKYFKKVANIESVSFYDNNFFTDKEFSISLCKSFITSKLNLLWEAGSHAGIFIKYFSEHDVELFYKSGCRQLFIGAESGSQEILDLINKNLIVEDNIAFAKITKNYNITPVFLTIIGFPFNPDKDANATFEMIRKAKIINKSLKTRIHLFVPIPNTKMYEIAVNKGFKIPENLDKYNSVFSELKTPWIKKDYRWKLETYVNFYIPMADPFLYKYAPDKIKPVAFIINKLFYPIAILRFKLNFFKFPIEAIIFLFLLKIFNKIMKTNITLFSESYLNKNSLGFYY